MSKQVVFPCPQCGATLSVDSSAGSVQCQFCGSTAAVPAALRDSAPSIPSYSPYAAPAPTSGLAFGGDRSKLAAIGDAVRSGDKGLAIRLYQEQFGVDQPTAAQVVDQLAAGQSVLVGTMANGLPEYLQVSQVAPAAPYYVPMMTPVMPDANRIFRGVMGFNIAITLAIFAFSACIVVFVFLAIGLAFVPAMFGGLAPFFSR
jgi:hypothetical protein